MTHLYIEQNTGLTEEVNSTIISKLYELAVSGDLDSISDLKGRLHSVSGKKLAINYLNTTFDNLYITADNMYEYFEDSNTEELVKRYVGTSEGVTLSDMQSVIGNFDNTHTNSHTSRQGTFFLNSTEKQSIQKFNEFQYFTGVTTLQRNAFDGCTSLSQITLPTSLTTINQNAFSDVPASTIDLSNVQYIGQQAFFNAGISGVVNLPNLTSLGTGAFQGCQYITECNIGPNLSTIGDASFLECSGLTKVTGLSNITTIPARMFYDCTSLTTVDIDFSSITALGGQCMSNCGLQVSLDLSNVTTLGNDALFHCRNITILSFPRIEALVDRAFCGIGNTSITIPKEVKQIGSMCFSDCSQLQNVTFESNSLITTIGNATFRYCNNLQSIIIPEHLTTVVEWAFSNCQYLTTIDLPDTVTSIGDYACRWSGSISTFICRATTPPTLGIDVFSSNNLNIYVPDASVSAYQSASNWSTYSSKIKGISQLPNS